jgi:peptidoglycan/LPS O-acetylase OafA/YrhL
VQLGAESYALYLIHLPLVLVLARLLRTAGAPWYIAFPLLAAAAVIAAKLYYRFYEQAPLMRRLEPHKRPKRDGGPEA